jgi:NADPH-dependent F420 reductase
MHIGVIGGTGREGKGLAMRWARAGHDVGLGSRDPERARTRAQELSEMCGALIQGGTNEWAIERAEVVVLCVPYAAHAATLRSLKRHLEGRILIDITVPLRPPRVHEVHLPPGHSAALEAQAILGPATPVVATLHHVSSNQLADLETRHECDVLVCGDHDDARATVGVLVKELGFRALDAGPLQNAVALEALTPVLIHLTKRYKSPGAAVRFAHLPLAG